MTHSNPIGSEELPSQVASARKLVLGDTDQNIETRLRMAVIAIRSDREGLPKSYWTDLIEDIYTPYIAAAVVEAEQLGFLKGRLEENVRYFGEYRPLIETSWINTKPISIIRIREEMKALEIDIARLSPWVMCRRPNPQPSKGDK